jgi:hypothetical protein
MEATMKKRDYALMLTVAMFFGLVGGGMMSWVFNSQLVFAQKTAGHEKVIMAEEFRLVDKDGAQLATLHVDQTGQPNMIINDIAHTPRLTMSFGSEGALKFGLNDKKGKKTVFMEVDDKGAATLGMGIPNIRFSVSADGRPFLYLSDGTRPRAVLGLWPDGDPNLTLIGKDGNRRAVLGSIEPETSQIAIIDKRPISSLVLYGEDGRVIWNTP